MKFVCRQASLRGSVAIPGSKSHTIRAVAIGSLAAGTSRIEGPLDSGDARSAVTAFTALGARIECAPDHWTIHGTGGVVTSPDQVINVGNSGTTLRIALGAAALARDGTTVFSGDDQIQRRPCGPLLAALNDLGADATSSRDNGCPPIHIRGPLRGGETSIECLSSQYLTSLLISTPLAETDSVIHVPVLHERPYVEITLDWLRQLSIQVAHDDLRTFRVRGGQQYQPFQRRIPADFSSATFFLVAGALGENDITVPGLDLDDPQGDKAVIDYLRQLGAQVEITGHGVRVRPGPLRGCRLDLNATPDALPMMAVIACFAEGTTTLTNVPQARIKETDRLAVMRQELGRLGARITEQPDGLVIEQSDLNGTEVDGHDDHRVVMALAVAGCVIPGRTIVRTAESATITFPTFAERLRDLGGEIDLIE